MGGLRMAERPSCPSTTASPITIEAPCVGTSGQGQLPCPLLGWLGTPGEEVSLKGREDVWGFRGSVDSDYSAASSPTSCCTETTCSGSAIEDYDYYFGGDDEGSVKDCDDEEWGEWWIEEYEGGACEQAWDDGEEADFARGLEGKNQRRKHTESANPIRGHCDRNRGGR